MREIIFRGKRRDNGSWETGSLVVARAGCSDETVCVADKMTGYHTPVAPETIGQYTGLRDERGTDIFEGDIVLGLFLFGLSVKSVVDFRGGAFGLKWDRGGVEEFSAFTSICNVTYEVIGNIHENPELWDEQNA